MSTLTLRISLIPASIPEDQFFVSLEDFVHRSCEAGEQPGRIILRSFAPSAVSADRERDRVATATIERIPLVFRVGGFVQLELGGVPVPVHVDSTFIGLTSLYHPTGEVTVE